VTSMPPFEKSVSRREFARRTALGAVGLLVRPEAGSADSTAGAPLQVAPQNAPNLSPQSQAEAEARWQSILAQYGDRFSEAQKSDLHRLSIFVQPSLDRIRAYPISNSSLPAVFLKPLVDRDKKSTSPSSSGKPANTTDGAKAKP
jgi:hypothetical protein